MKLNLTIKEKYNNHYCLYKNGNEIKYAGNNIISALSGANYGIIKILGIEKIIQNLVDSATQNKCLFSIKGDKLFFVEHDDDVWSIMVQKFQETEIKLYKNDKYKSLDSAIYDIIHDIDIIKYTSSNTYSQKDTDVKIFEDFDSFLESRVKDYKVMKRLKTLVDVAKSFNAVTITLNEEGVVSFTSNERPEEEISLSSCVLTHESYVEPAFDGSPWEHKREAIEWFKLKSIEAKGHKYTNSPRYHSDNVLSFSLRNYILNNFKINY